MNLRDGDGKDMIIAAVILNLIILNDLNDYKPLFFNYWKVFYVFPEDCFDRVLNCPWANGMGPSRKVVQYQ